MATTKPKAKFFTHSRSCTPEPTLLSPDDQPYTNRDYDEKSDSGDSQTVQEGDIDAVFRGVGLLSDEVYAKNLGPWRAGFRQWVVRSVQWESNVLGRMQQLIRTPFLDAYFVYTSSLGTHTFFMTVLPAFYFFGYDAFGRGLLLVLAFGVYLASFLKDLICAPRPYAPPVARLTIGDHHLEYGFPSTHSTNSMSIALQLFTAAYTLYTTPATQTAAFSAAVNSTLTLPTEDILVPETMLSRGWFMIASGVLGFYIFSIVFGRLYTGMHSFTDCVVGILLGVFIWAVHFFFGNAMDNWVANAGWIVPATIIPLSLLLVHRHPQPVDDCPCFEDAIAFISVAMGQYLTRWVMGRYQLDQKYLSVPMPGHPLGSWSDASTWWTIAIMKMITGVLAIFAWRFFAKFLMHRILPPIFRFLAQLFTLPRRRFYTPATDYKNVPAEKGLRAIPSVIDFGSGGDFEIDGIGASTAHSKELSHGQGRQIKLRKGGSKLEKSPLSYGDSFLGLEELGGKEVEVVKHYDADVLTKVFVYCGIAVVATGVMPVVFAIIGWGLVTN
ncbi:hypothetical protein BXZ70DRAFT_932625 [Cristinia sonorae]|uniref:Phosphatidic acid phosphatase type 2/haloperoxidase domain-containing protein n=1 Tax=Cristinia sonorae TaxID=1940300 RepID=A0A8K0UT14_9AGAR|nr:hypothetical protein BXZ70DRAFT_932625 [Cristinia sonorae]